MAVGIVSILLSSCNFHAVPNDGSLAVERRNQGYIAPSTDTSAKFWLGHAPFCGIQVWTTDEWGYVWGEIPEINLDEGTFASPNIGVYMPVFGLYDEKGAGLNGDYDLSEIASFECDVWIDEPTTEESEISVYHAPANTKKFVPKTEREHIVMELVPQNKGHILFLFSWNTKTENNVFHVENVAFYDKNGNQVTNIPYTLTD